MKSIREVDLRSWLALVAVVALPMAASGADIPPSVPASAPPHVIEDITHWQHPVKAVFSKYQLPLQRVTLQGRHAVFRVAFPFDPQTQPNAATMDALYLDLLRANGGEAYTLESLQDGIAIDVAWNGRSRTIAIAVRRL